MLWSPNSKEKWKKDIDRIVKDQGQLREHMKALRGSARERALLQRYTQQRDEQETQLETLRQKIQDTEAQRDKANEQLEKRIGDLQLGTTLLTFTLRRGPTCPNRQVASNAHSPPEQQLPAARDLHSRRARRPALAAQSFRSALPERATGGAPKVRRIVLFLAIVLLALETAPSATAGPQKKGTATVTGVVLGPDDQPVPHAAVTYQSSGGNAPHATHADAHGRFTITKLRADNYDIRASGRGVFSEWQKNLTVRPGQTKNLTLRLIYAKQVPKAYVKTKPNPQ